MANRYVGQRIKRTEDPRLIRGLGQYVDDIKLPDTLNVAFLRSIHAHARIKSVDLSVAAQASGVVAIYTDRGKPVHIISKVGIRMKKWLLYVVPTVAKSWA